MDATPETRLLVLESRRTHGFNASLTPNLAIQSVRNTPSAAGLSLVSY